jgi:hypothetical protein
MPKVRTPWPVAFQECRKRWGVSARRFCSAAEIAYSTFARWWAPVQWPSPDASHPPRPEGVGLGTLRMSSSAAFLRKGFMAQLLHQSASHIAAARV